jgi:hypothetical protein
MRLTSLLALALVAWLAVASACAFPSQKRQVVWTLETTPDDTRIYNFMGSSSKHMEPRSDYLMDEATIVSLRPERACFHLIVRSEHHVDLHPSQWRVKVNGKAAHVEQREEPDRTFWRTTVRDSETVYSRRTERSETVVTRPVEYERVGGYAVRHAHACAPLAGIPRELRLQIKLPDPIYRDHWGQTYVWELVGGPPSGPPGLPIAEPALANQTQ